MPLTATRDDNTGNWRHCLRRRLTPHCFGFVGIFLFSFLSSQWRSSMMTEEDIQSVSLFLLSSIKGQNSTIGSSSSSEDSSFAINNDNYQSTATTKLLYTITTLSEYNSGKRSTAKGSDRFQETLIPIVSESVNSMLEYGYDVDVYLICGFILRPERKLLLQQALPPFVGLEVWDDAMPMNYNMRDINNNITAVQAKIENHTRGLARQHRFVIRDKLPHYDIFVNFEDDMLIKGEHVDNYVQMTQHLQRLREHAPSTSGIIPHYFGNLTKQQLKRTIPGFMRVEAVLNETETPIPPLSVKIPVDLQVNGVNRSLDVRCCCHVSDRIANPRLPKGPSSHDLIIWETQILPLGVRRMPESQPVNTEPSSNSGEYSLDWVALLRGTDKSRGLPDYWSGTDGYYQNDTVDWRPATNERKYVNNMGGYMATRRQILEWHLDICAGGGFLPPFSGHIYGNFDGLDFRDVEYWSGGIQLVTHCGLQRIINLHHNYFPRHILYHTSNNKQKQLQNVKERFTRLDELYGMLNTVRKNAERAIPKVVEYQSQLHRKQQQIKLVKHVMKTHGETKKHLASFLQTNLHETKTR